MFSLVAHSYQNSRDNSEERDSNSRSRAVSVTTIATIVTTITTIATIVTIATQLVKCLVYGAYADTVKTGVVVIYKSASAAAKCTGILGRKGVETGLKTVAYS